MEDEVFPHIMSASTSKQAWDTLQEVFQGSKKVRSIKLQALRRDFENIKMKENEIVKDYFLRIKEIVNQMRSNGENFFDKKIVEKILIYCTEKFDTIIFVIE